MNTLSVMCCKLVSKEHLKYSYCTYLASRQTILIKSIWHVCTDVIEFDSSDVVIGTKRTVRISIIKQFCNNCL